MRTRLPIQSQNTERILKSVLPSDFKMVNDKNSNGYKFVNLLYGVEIDETLSTIKEIYRNSFINTFDLSKNYEIYEVTLSGSPNNNYLNSSGIIPIKITDTNEFYNGSPTRVSPLAPISIPMYYVDYTGEANASIAGFNNSFFNGMKTVCWSELSGFVGLEYFRDSQEGSGYILINSDIDQEIAYHSELYPTFRCDVGTNFQTSGDYLSVYGLYTGIKDQNYNVNTKNEILYPIDEKTLSGKYPLKREILDDSGYIHTIDHYTPYNGWVKNEYGEVVAVVDYSGYFYFDGDGNKVYYKTAYNNPYGYNNYNTAFLDIEHIPISGTLRVYDIDILDSSGNATEIPYSGKMLYYYKSTNNSFDPIYLGYESSVPSGAGFSSIIEGQPTVPLKLTSWDYLHDGGNINPGTLIYEDGQGPITNRIKLSNYHSRYLVEYKYKVYDKIKCFTSLDSNGTTSLHTSSPVYTITNYSGGLKEINYEFTKDVTYENENTKILTFDGFEVRPNKHIHNIDFNIPIKYQIGNLTNKLFINVNNKFVGYSNEFVPQEISLRRYVLNCQFDQTVVLNSVSEIDHSGNGNDLDFINTGNNQVLKINYDTKFGKKILRGTVGDSYFGNVSKSFILDNVFFEFNFKSNIQQDIILMDIQDLLTNKYILVAIDINGQLIIECDGYIFKCRDKIEFNNKEKLITIKYIADELSQSVPTFIVYNKEKSDIGYKINPNYRANHTITPVSSTYFNVFKNCNVDIGYVKIFYEAQ